MSQATAFESGLVADNSSIDHDNSECYLATLHAVYDVIMVDEMQGNSYNPARSRAVLRDMQRRLVGGIECMGSSQSTYFDVGLSYLVESLWEALAYREEPEYRHQLGVRVIKAKRILVTLITLLDSHLAAQHSGRHLDYLDHRVSAKSERFAADRSSGSVNVLPIGLTR